MKDRTCDVCNCCSGERLLTFPISLDGTARTNVCISCAVEAALFFRAIKRRTASAWHDGQSVGKEKEAATKKSEDIPTADPVEAQLEHSVTGEEEEAFSKGLADLAVKPKNRPRKFPPA